MNEETENNVSFTVTVECTFTMRHLGLDGWMNKIRSSGESENKRDKIADGRIPIVVDSRRVWRQLNGNGRRIVAFSCWLAGWLRHGVTERPPPPPPPQSLQLMWVWFHREWRRTNERKKEEENVLHDFLFFTPWSNSLSLRDTYRHTQSQSRQQQQQRLLVYKFDISAFFGSSLHLGAPASFYRE